MRGPGPDRSGPLPARKTPAMDRYERQARFRPLGPEGQAALGRAVVTVVGVGALGSAAAELLGRAGVGALRLVDRDVVEVGNLHRQSLFDEEDAREAIPKAEAAARHLHRIRSDLGVQVHVVDLDGTRARELLAGSTVILDGSDNFEARHLLNEASLDLDLPWVHAACLGSRAVAWPLVPGRGACWACHVPDIPAPGDAETCETAGIIAPAVQAAVAVQVAECLKLIAGRVGDVLPGPWTADVWEGSATVVRSTRDPECAACGRREWRLLGRRREGTWVACGGSAVQLRPAGLVDGLDLGRLARRLTSSVPVRQNRHLLRFQAEGHLLTVFHDGRVVVGGTRDVDRARVLVARHLGG